MSSDGKKKVVFLSLFLSVGLPFVYSIDSFEKKTDYYNARYTTLATGGREDIHLRF